MSMLFSIQWGPSPSADTSGWHQPCTLWEVGAEEEDWIVLLRGEDDLNLTGDWRQSNEVTGDGQCVLLSSCVAGCPGNRRAMLLLECICFCSSPSDVYAISIALKFYTFTAQTKLFQIWQTVCQCVHWDWLYQIQNFNGNFWPILMELRPKKGFYILSTSYIFNGNFHKNLKFLVRYCTNNFFHG